MGFGGQLKKPDEPKPKAIGDKTLTFLLHELSQPKKVEVGDILRREISFCETLSFDENGLPTEEMLKNITSHDLTLEVLQVTERHDLWRSNQIKAKVLQIHKMPELIKTT